MQVGGSGWTEAIPLDSSAAASTGEATSKPVLVRAHVPEWGTVNEIVSHLDIAGTGYERTLVSTGFGKLTSNLHSPAHDLHEN